MDVEFEREERNHTKYFYKSLLACSKSYLTVFPTEGVSWFPKKRSMEEKVRLKQGKVGLFLRTVILIIIHSVLAALLPESFRALSR